MQLNLKIEEAFENFYLNISTPDQSQLNTATSADRKHDSKFNIYL